MKRILKQLEQILIAFDQLVTVLLGLILVIVFRHDVYWSDESLSARSWRLRARGWSVAYKLINALFFWQSNHCKTAYESEQKRRHLPPEYRN